MSELLTDDVLERLFAKIDRSGSGCHEWLAGKNSRGYGKIEIAGKTYLSHRLILELKQPGFLASGLHACHSCDNPGCNNPDHLFAGTASDNMRDRSAKGRDLSTRIANTGHKRTRGNKNGQAKLTEAEVIQIVDLISQGLSNTEIAELFNISHVTISQIKTGRRWGWLTGLDKTTHAVTI